MNRKPLIESTLQTMYEDNYRRIASLTDRVSLLSYRPLAQNGIWTAALQKALEDHEIVEIPATAEPYLIDASIRIPSNRHIEVADGAVIRLAEGTRVLMMRNENTLDGTHMPYTEENCNSNISINGGRWEEYHRSRAGYGKSGMYDEERSYHGVSTCMLFNHIEGLTLTNMTFAHCAGFAVQCGDARNVVFENITFDSCYADGLHLNGNMKNVLARNIQGEVGDDLVALNTYDWQNSSVNFGPMTTVLCENLTLAPTSHYKALRIEPGIYTYDDGSEVDCSLNDAIIRGVKGIHTFKMYYQTPAYDLTGSPEPGRPGSASHIYFEDIEVDLTGPIDAMDAYLNSDPLRGAFASFELGSNIDYISFENIQFTLHKEEYPLSYPILIGPKSIREGHREVFDPYISNHVEHLHFKNVKVNGRSFSVGHIKINRFHDINHDGRSTGTGSIGRISNFC